MISGFVSISRGRGAELGSAPRGGRLYRATTLLRSSPAVLALGTR